ncbi:MAG: hypothetical protein ACXAC2_20865, partial [Candidatus Kariarchaeaceae archaeon]
MSVYLNILLDIMKNQDYRFCRYILDKLPDYLIVIISIGALYLVIKELKALTNQNEQIVVQNESIRKQTDLLEATVRQTYRPVAAVDPMKPTTLFRVTNMNQYMSNPEWQDFPDSLKAIEVRINIFNYGKGPLIYHGPVSYVSDEFIDFRAKLLNDEIEDGALRFDAYRVDSREQFVLDNKSFKSEIFHPYFTPKSQQYFHFILLYSDVDGNLYDTYFSQFIKFDPITKKSAMDQDSKSRWMQTYH